MKPIAMVVVPQCCECLSHADRARHPERFPLVLQFGELFTPTGGVFGRRQFRELRRNISALGQEVTIETAYPEEVRRALGVGVDEPGIVTVAR